MKLTWPIKVESEANKREHFRSKAKRTSDQRSEVRYNWHARFGTEPKLHFRLPVVIHLTRIGRKELDDDNLAGAFKHVRDELALMLLPRQTRTVVRSGVAMQEEWADDSDKRLAWIYSQKTRRNGGYAIEVEITEVSEEVVSAMRCPATLLGLVRKSVLDRPDAPA